MGVLSVAWKNKVMWVPTYIGGLMKRAVLAGFDKDGNLLYVGRALLFDRLLPATVAYDSCTVFMPPSNVQNIIQDSEVLVLNGGRAEWVPAINGGVPHAALPVGSVNGEKLYVARVKHGNALIPGFLQPSMGMSIVVCCDEVFGYQAYEVLCIF